MSGNKKTIPIHYREIGLIFFLLSGMAITPLHAQNKMVVKEKSGMQTAFSLNRIQKITFPVGSMSVNKTNESTFPYSLNNLRSINFTGDNTDGVAILISKPGSIQLFPNPVSDILHIRFNDARTGLCLIEIIDILGNEIEKLNVECQSGANNLTISTADLATGLYLLRIQNNDQTESIKFYKY
jgi:hypothetical protein